MKQLTIGKLSELTGVSTKTIRYYEEIDLISESIRSENSYRVFSDSAIEELKMIKSARDLGLPIAEIKTLLQGCEEGNCRHSSSYLRKEISDYVSLVGAKIIQLTELKRRLTNLKLKLPRTHDDCADESNYCCNILHQLVDQEGGEIKNA